MRVIALLLALVIGQLADSSKPIPASRVPDGASLERLLTPDECGDPKMVSSGYGSARGLILGVLGPTVLDVRLEDGQRQQVYLSGVTARSLSRADRKRAIGELQRLVVGKRFDALSSLAIGASDARSFTARVFAANEEVNAFLLERGLLRYEQNSRHVDWWTACHYEREEAEAKEGGLGIWRSEATTRSNNRINRSARSRVDGFLSRPSRAPGYPRRSVASPKHILVVTRVGAVGEALCS